MSTQLRSNGPSAVGRRMARLRGVSLKDLVYSVYERRLTASLEGKPRPQHVGVMCDGNRRWAKEMGYVDPNDGHRVGARRGLDLLRGGDAAGIRDGTPFPLAP